jgi:hypothetical protein
MKLKVKPEEQGQHFYYLKKLEFDLNEDRELLPPWNPYLRVRLSTVDLLIRVAHFVKKVTQVYNKKAADLN